MKSRTERNENYAYCDLIAESSKLCDKVFIQSQKIKGASPAAPAYIHQSHIHIHYREMISKLGEIRRRKKKKRMSIIDPDDVPAAAAAAASSTHPSAADVSAAAGADTASAAARDLASGYFSPGKRE